MTILQSLENNLKGIDFIETPDLIRSISFDTGYTYESVRCNTFRYKEKLPEWFFNEFTYVSRGRGRGNNSYIKRGKCDYDLTFNKEFVYDFLFNGLDKNLTVTTFPGQKGEDVKYLLDKGFNNINCIEKNNRHLTEYKKNNFHTKDYNNIFSDVIESISTDVLYYDSCSYLNLNHINDLDLINKLNIKHVFITFKNINNKHCDYNLFDFIKERLNSFTYIDKKEYVSRTQNMIVFKYAKKIQSFNTR